MIGRNNAVNTNIKTDMKLTWDMINTIQNLQLDNEVIVINFWRQPGTYSECTIRKLFF